MTTIETAKKAGWWPRFKCETLGWHTPERRNPYTTDGCTLLSRCERCGRRIGQDSQGNWFSMELPDDAR